MPEYLDHVIEDEPSQVDELLTEADRLNLEKQIRAALRDAYATGATDFEPSAANKAIQDLQDPSLSLAQAKQIVARFMGLMSTRTDYH